MSDQTVAPPTTAETPPPEAPEPTTPEAEEGEAPAPKEPDLDRAFAALKNKKDRLRRDREQVAKERAALAQEREASKAREAELAKKAALADAIAAGDEEALVELMGADFFDKLTQRRLNPERAEIEKAFRSKLGEYEKRLEDQARAIEEMRNERRRVEVASMQRNFVNSARGLGLEALDLLEDDEIIRHADAISAEWRQQNGEDPTFQQLAEAIAAREARRLERARAKFGSKAEPPAPAPPKGKGKAPSTLTASDATTPAGAGKGGKESIDAFKARLAQELAKKL